MDGNGWVCSPQRIISLVQQRQRPCKAIDNIKTMRTHHCWSTPLTFMQQGCARDGVCHCWRALDFPLDALHQGKEMFNAIFHLVAWLKNFSQRERCEAVHHVAQHGPGAGGRQDCTTMFNVVSLVLSKKRILAPPQKRVHTTCEPLKHPEAIGLHAGCTKCFDS